ncbi:hypothetical protein AVEN_30246-1, partial [Araneus ventricosus]
MSPVLSSYCLSGDPQEDATPTFSPTTIWQHQKNHINPDQKVACSHPVRVTSVTSRPTS